MTCWVELVGCPGRPASLRMAGNCCSYADGGDASLVDTELSSSYASFQCEVTGYTYQSTNIKKKSQLVLHDSRETWVRAEALFSLYFNLVRGDAPPPPIPQQTCEPMLSVTASRLPDSMPCVSARVKVTLPSLTTPDDDITRPWVDAGVCDREVVGGRLVSEWGGSEQRRCTQRGQKHHLVTGLCFQRVRRSLKTFLLFSPVIPVPAGL